LLAPISLTLQIFLLRLNLGLSFRGILFFNLCVVIYFFSALQSVQAQGFPQMPLIGSRENKSLDEDSLGLNSNKKKWTNPPAKIYFTTQNEQIKQYPDTSTFLLHRLMNVSSWYHYLGNYGNPALNMKFTPDKELGLKMNYNVFVPYQFKLENIPYFNTTRPYSQFIYSLGSKQEQVASLLHTQNITPNWNFALLFRNINSPGFFQNQFANYNGGFLSSNYLSKNQKYSLKLGMVLNKNRSDESGGITADSFLTMSNIVDRRQIPTVITNIPTSSSRSTVLNQYRNTEINLDHSYRWGVNDTLYNEDSTQMTPRFTPKFALRHQFQTQLDKHTFHDRLPNYKRYAFIADSLPFVYNDTNRNEQYLNSFINKFSFLGFIGKPGKQANIEAGIGNGIHQIKDKLSTNASSTTVLSNFIFGKISKEALSENQWSYNANAIFHFAGYTIGDLLLQANISKHFSNIGSFDLGILQTLTTPPVNATKFATNYYVIENDLKKSSYTTISAGLYIDKLKLRLSGNNILAGNYIYYDTNYKVQQYENVFNVFQIQAVQDFKIGYYHAYTEGLIQQLAGAAPINIPFLMLRHISAYERYIFQNKLWFNVGLEMRYNTPFVSSGYSPYFNQFLYRTGVEKSKNLPEFTAFLNFRVKQFRLFVSGDQLQQLIFKKNVMHFPLYPMQNAMVRFGVNWVLYN